MRIRKTVFSEILALPNDDDFIRNLKNKLNCKIYPWQYDQLERYFVAITNRLNGVKIDKHDHFKGGGLYSSAQKPSLKEAEPAFCKAVQKNDVYEVSKKLLIKAMSQNYQGFKGYDWPFKIDGCGSGPNKYLPEFFVRRRNQYQYSPRSRDDIVHEVGIVVFYLLHFARLPIANSKYFTSQGGSGFQYKTGKQTYFRLFITFLNMLLPDLLKSKKRKNRGSWGPQFVQVFGEVWLCPSFSDSPVHHRIALLPLMKALVRRVVITQAFHQWEWKNVGVHGKEESFRTCLSLESQSLQRPLFEFLFQAFKLWPLDRGQDIVKVVDMWIQFLTPWKIEQERYISMTNKEFQELWGEWVAENLPFYTTLLKEFLRFSVNMDFRRSWACEMLNKVSKTFDDRLLGLIKEKELTAIDSAHGFRIPQNELWIRDVKIMVAHCYLPDTDDHWLAFHKPSPIDTQICLSLCNRKRKSKSLKLASDNPCFKIVEALIQNILISKAMTNEPTTISWSTSLWIRMFGSVESKPDHDACVKELVRIFQVDLETLPAPVEQISGAVRFCEVDEGGHLTEVGRQQLISGQKIIDPENYKLFRMTDVWEKPPMEFEIVFLLDLMRKLESALLKYIGTEEQTKKNYFLYGIGRRFASTSAVFWCCICSCWVYYWNPVLLIFGFTISFGLVGVLTILPNELLE